MKIVRNSKRESQILDQIRDSFTKEGPREGVHLSDLLNPRRSFWQRALPLPPTNAEVLYWLAGRGHEDALGRVAGLVITEQKVTDSGISYRPDFTFAGAVLGEFKTRRANLAKPGEEAAKYESYLEQLRGYCAIEDAPYGILLVLSLIEGRSHDPRKPTEPALAAYDVFISAEELEATRVLLEERRQGFVAALDTGDCSQLPLCKNWMCGKPSKVTEQAPYCETCKQEFKTEYGASQHRHPIRPAIVRWEYAPCCKWYEHCRPQAVDPARGARAQTCEAPRS